MADPEAHRKRRAALKWLELDVGAAVVSEEDVVAAYRRLAKLYHPDKNGGSPEAVARCVWATNSRSADPMRTVSISRHDTVHAALGGIVTAFAPSPVVVQGPLRSSSEGGR